MKKTKDQLLEALRNEEEKASQYTHGELANEREDAYREYLRKPYGNEEDGRSGVVSSDVMDAIEGMLPDILDVFVASDKAVQFDAQGEEDVEAAEQATNACNYVFYRQNNGFLLLYTAVKDALLLKTGGVKWAWEEKRTPIFTTYKGVTADQITQYMLEHPDTEILEQEEREEQAQDPMTGQPIMQLVYDVKTKTIEQKGKVALYSIPPEELIVSADHNSILLDNCAYVAHVCKRRLTDIVEMGFDVSVEDIKAAADDVQTVDRRFRKFENGTYTEDQRPDDEMLDGWFKEEYILFDMDGDGIAERLRVYRLGEIILDVQEVSHVQIAAWTPYILTHQFEGLSVRDLVTDIQKMKTEIWRQSLDNLYATNNQQKAVLTDSNGNPQANIDDLLNPRPGGILREYVQGAIRPLDQKWMGAQIIPMIEFLDQNKENRTGFTRYSQGLDSDALNQTARGVSLIMNASQKRMKLMARVMAECLVAPMFRGIFKTLTDYCMEKLSFRLNGKFVQYDPQEWRDGYDMVINVGLGTGDKEQNMLAFQQIAMTQEKMIAAGMTDIVTKTNIHALAARMAENAGFKNTSEFFTKPQEGGLPPEIQQQLDEMQQTLQQLQQENQQLKTDKSLEFEKINVDKFNADTNRIKATQAPVPTTNITMTPNGIKEEVEGEGEEEVSRLDMLEQALMQVMAQQNAPKTKTTRMIKVGDGEYVAETVENGW